jgi:FixJ family two-component response regulator
MYNRKLHILLVEDDADDYVITRDLLSEIEDIVFELDWVSSYDAALEEIKRDHHDVYLLDYRLGAHNGLDLLKQAIANGCKAPMILLTGQGDREVDIEAMNAGADEYLVKGRIDSLHLERSIRYAFERRRLLMEIERRERELEVRSLEQISHPAGPAVLSQETISTLPLREAMPETFEELVHRYGNLLDTVLEQDVSEEYNISEELSGIGTQLGALNVEAADVVAIHTEAFKRRLRDDRSQRAQAYMRESRLMVIELMGKLVSFYRDSSLGIRAPQPSKDEAKQ